MATPTFQRKQYEAVAAVIRAIDNPAERLITSRRFSTAFAADNPRFDSKRFSKACDVDTLTG